LPGRVATHSPIIAASTELKTMDRAIKKLIMLNE
jgi:hypothetical protein